MTKPINYKTDKHDVGGSTKLGNAKVLTIFLILLVTFFSSCSTLVALMGFYDESNQDSARKQVITAYTNALIEKNEATWVRFMDDYRQSPYRTEYYIGLSIFDNFLFNQADQLGTKEAYKHYLSYYATPLTLKHYDYCELNIDYLTQVENARNIQDIYQRYRELRRILNYFERNDLIRESYIIELGSEVDIVKLELKSQLVVFLETATIEEIREYLKAFSDLPFIELAKQQLEVLITIEKQERYEAWLNSETYKTTRALASDKFWESVLTLRYGVLDLGENYSVADYFLQPLRECVSISDITSDSIIISGTLADTFTIIYSYIFAGDMILIAKVTIQSSVDYLETGDFYDIYTFMILARGNFFMSE